MIDGRGTKLAAGAAGGGHNIEAINSDDELDEDDDEVVEYDEEDEAGVSVVGVYTVTDNVIIPSFLKIFTNIHATEDYGENIFIISFFYLHVYIRILTVLFCFEMFL